MPPLATPDAKSKIPATVARLFVPAATWTWPTKISTRDFDFTNETITTGTLACTVAATTARPEGWNTRLECTATPPLPRSFPSELVGTPTGLWELVEGASLDPARSLIDEPPGGIRGGGDDIYPEGRRGTIVEAHRGGWCFGESEALEGHVSSWTLCVRGGDLVGGTSMVDQVKVTWGDTNDP